MGKVFKIVTALIYSLPLQFFLRMNSIDVKSLIIGALLTTVVFMGTGWQTSGVQKVEIVQGSFANAIKVKIDGEVELERGGSSFSPMFVKQAP